MRVTIVMVMIFFLEFWSPRIVFTFLSQEQVEIINELEERSNENRASEGVDNKKQNRVKESETAVHASGGKYRGLHGVLS